MFPVEAKIGEIRDALANKKCVVLTAPPGSGKTTCVPPVLMDEPWLKGKKIVMLEPRRIAARSSATYMAGRIGESVGARIGYQVRLERKISKATQLEVVTEGLLTQRILSDPELNDIGLIIFDEFHERSLQCDMAFALALEVRRALRPDLRLLIMSATLDVEPILKHIGDAILVRAEGRMFPVTTEYLGECTMESAIGRALKETDGDILCFLPGEGEIMRTLQKIDGMFFDVEILPLYGSLSKDAQDKVFDKSFKRKVILSTSITETSLTIDGISAVVDSGLMRTARFSPSTGMSGLVTLPLTLDRAEQRRGRAGRVKSGVCYRLWTKESEASRSEKATCEVLEQDLTSLVLTSVAWGALHRKDLPWLTLPADSNWEKAVELLRHLGALDERGQITDKGRKMSMMNMHPRLANMVLGGGDPTYAAIIEEGARERETDIRYIKVTSRIKELARRFATKKGCAYLSAGASLALAYPERVARNRGNGTFRMVNGRGAFLEESDPLSHEKYLVCCALDDRLGNARIWTASPITEGEIRSIFGDKLHIREICEWDKRTDSVKSVRQELLGEMVLSEKSQHLATGTAQVMIEGVRIKGLDNLPCWTKGAREYRLRIDFLSRIDDAWPKLDDETLLEALSGFITEGMTKWRDLEKIDLIAVMNFILAEHKLSVRELDRLAPARITMPSGRSYAIHYEGVEPTVEVKLQECFGMAETPRVAGGKVPIVMTLLSPAQRPVQITKDLAGFWRGAYQLVRKDMRGRYPKHDWPENPIVTGAATKVLI